MSQNAAEIDSFFSSGERGHQADAEKTEQRGRANTAATAETQPNAAPATEPTATENGEGKKGKADGRGRPPLPDNERLDNRITVRLTSAQFERIETIAEAREVKPSVAARQLLASQRVNQRTRQLRSIRRELRDLGGQIRNLQERDDEGSTDFDQAHRQVLERIYTKLAEFTPA